ncbi:hypothetical protein V8E54_005369 [Elaphomyces granulatus]
MGRQMNTVVWSHFTTLMAPDGKTRLNVDTATGRPPKTLQHLEKCVVYQSRIAEEKKL